jgi:CheY-like chemotaxis protein
MIKVLYLDDSDDLGNTAVTTFNFFGFNTVHLTDPEQALEELGTRHFDFIVADYNLGEDKINGVQFLEKVLDRYPNKYCKEAMIVHTGTIEDEDLYEIESRAYKLLTKPASLDCMERLFTFNKDEAA